MLVHVKTLSLWEIAHYWHDCDPRLSSTRQIPLKVRDTLLVLTKTSSCKISLYVEKHRAYLLKLFSYIQQIATECFLQNLQESIDKKVFDKRLFNCMLMTRNELARWCIENNEPLPKFWFPDNDKYPYDLEGDEMVDSERYEFILIHDETKKTVTNSVIKPKVTPTVSSNAIKAANAKHAGTNAIKDRFICFYLAESSKYPSKKATAENFFNSLDKREQLSFSTCETAARTFLDALRKHEKQTKSL
jgi:hypothetical protein